MKGINRQLHCLLDEPMRGMYVASCRQMWSFLQSEREGRVVFLTTHFMDEVDMKWTKYMSSLTVCRINDIRNFELPSKMLETYSEVFLEKRYSFCDSSKIRVHYGKCWS